MDLRNAVDATVAICTCCRCGAVNVTLLAVEVASGALPALWDEQPAADTMAVSTRKAGSRQPRFSSHHHSVPVPGVATSRHPGPGIAPPCRHNGWPGPGSHSAAPADMPVRRSAAQDRRRSRREPVVGPDPAWFWRRVRRLLPPSGLRRPVAAPSGCRRRSGPRSEPCCDTVRPPACRRRCAARSWCSSLPPSKMGAVTSAARPQKLVPELNSWLIARPGAARIGGQGDIWQAVRDGNSDLRAGGMQIRLRLAHIRTLRNQLRRHADRQIGRQVADSIVRMLSAGVSLGKRPVSTASR